MTAGWHVEYLARRWRELVGRRVSVIFGFADQDRYSCFRSISLLRAARRVSDFLHPLLGPGSIMRPIVSYPCEA